MNTCSLPPQRGATLIETLAVVTVAAIALSAGLPLFGEVRANIALRGSLSHTMSALALARTAAVERSANVVACPSAGERCNDSVLWHEGWIVFEDHNRNGRRSPDETLVLVTQPTPNLRIASSNGRKTIRFQPDGSSEGSNVSLTFCDRRGPAKARSLVLSNVGRLRTGTPTPPQIAVACPGTS